MTSHVHGCPCARSCTTFIHTQWLWDRVSLAQENMWPVCVTESVVRLNQGYAVHTFPKVNLTCRIWKKSPSFFIGCLKLLCAVFHWILTSPTLFTPIKLTCTGAAVQWARSDGFHLCWLVIVWARQWLWEVQTSSATANWTCGIFFPYLWTEIIYSAFRKSGKVCKKHGFLNRLTSIFPFFCLICANLLSVIQLCKKGPS